MKYLATGLIIIAFLLGGFFLFKDKLNPTELEKAFLRQSVPLPKQQPKGLTLNDIAKLGRATPSAEVNQQIFEVVEKLGKEGKKITFNNCNPDPQILKLSSQELILNNSGSKAIKIDGISSLKQVLPAGDSVVLKVEPALYPYSCEFVATSSATPQLRGLIYFPQPIIATGLKLFKEKAIETNILNLASCKAEYEVIKIKKGNSLTFKNTGKERERVILSGVWDFNLEIGGQDTRKVELDSGIYTISCQSKSSDFIPAFLIYIP